MIKITATGTLYSVSPVLTVGANNFQKRELILDDSYTRGGETFSNYMLVEFTGDRMQLLDNFKPGQLVTVEACVNGRIRPEDGKVFNSIRGLNINPYVSQHQMQGQGQPQGQYRQGPNGQQYEVYPPQQQTYQTSAPYGRKQQPQQYPPQQQGRYVNPETGLPFD